MAILQHDVKNSSNLSQTCVIPHRLQGCLLLKTAYPPHNDTDYPEQKHAGRVGLGPNYRTDADVSDKLKGLYEEAKGNLLHQPELVERGHARRTGELKRKEKEGNDEKPPLTQKAREVAGGDEPSASGSHQLPNLKRSSTKGSGDATVGDGEHALKD